MRIIISIFLVTCLLSPSLFAEQEKKSKWKGYDKTSFKVDGRPCYIVSPKKAAEGRPWLWRARFPGFHSEVDQLLLADGFHIAYINCSGMLGSPTALKHWQAFYKTVREKYQLNKKVALYGVSRGGLFVYRWAKTHPETVACMYNDTPVCDFKSWPGGHGKGKGDKGTWNNLLKQYKFDEAAALAYKDNPIDNLDPIAKAQIPIMHIVSENDQVVPPQENTYILKKNLEDLGHSVFYVISIEKGPRALGHHFDLTHPEIGANFIKKYCEFSEPNPIYLRSGLQNSRYTFETTKKGRVAFIGGSITQMKGWRNLVADSLKKRFPDTEFDFVFAGISSTDSTMGAFRLQQDIFARGKVDLLFMESAVNELHNSRKKKGIQRATEGIILNARRLNPNIDIIAQYFYDPSYIRQLEKGVTPWQIAALDRIAIQHSINAIDQTIRCHTLFSTKKMEEKKFGGVHPAPAGHEVYTEMINALFDKAWAKEKSSELKPHQQAWIYDKLSFNKGRFQSITEAKIKKGWKIVKNWQAKSGKVRAFDKGATYLEAIEPEAELELNFKGTAIGLAMIAGPDVGIISYSVDGAPFKKLNQFTRWSGGLHIPWIYMLETELDNKEHKLVLKTTNEKHKRSKGFACRFRYFAVNDAN